MIGKFLQGSVVDLLPEYPELIFTARKDLVFDEAYNQAHGKRFGFRMEDFKSIHFRKLIATELIRNHALNWWLKVD